MAGRQLEQVGGIARPIVEARGAFLVDVRIRRDHGMTSVEVFIDNDAGVTTELCSEISRELSRALDAAEVMQRRYYLVVSSPGTDRPLKFARQYPRNIGRNLQISFRGEHGNERVSGVLVSADPDSIVLRVGESETKKILFDSIIEARVMLPW